MVNIDLTLKSTNKSSDMSGLLTIRYTKRNNASLFSSFEKLTESEITNLQNYQPLYDRFFITNKTNYNHVCFNHKKYIKSLKKSEDNENIFKVVLSDGSIKQTFIKYVPIIDPLYYLIGKYKDMDEWTQKMPTIDNIHMIDKVNSFHNMAYVETFFTFLSTKLNETHMFPHCVMYYDSFLGTKHNYKHDVYDDINILERSDYFNEEYDKRFYFEDKSQLPNELMRKTYCRFRGKIEIVNNIPDNKEKNAGENIIYETINNEKSDLMYEDIFKVPNKVLNSKEDTICLEPKLVYSLDTVKTEPTSDTFTANYSDCETEYEHTNETSSYSDTSDFDSDETTDGSESSEYSDDESYESEYEGDEGDDEEDILNVCIKKMPVQLLCMEKNEDTLDNYISNNDISEIEWTSILAQIIFTLIVYQKVFDFTHNDLHTNNVMYTSTNKKNIIYIYNNKKYVIPTYGKIYKIIDFGRSIYRYKDNRYCSDCYRPKCGDASSQYNCEPFLKESKPVIEPNPSFDLCRLGCSLYEYFMDNMKNLDDNEIFQLITKWCMDDNGKNVAYKSNMDERYPGFLLYKMIVRTVHGNIPSTEIKNKIFQNYCVGDTNKQMKKLFNSNIQVNIDEMQQMYDD